MSDTRLRFGEGDRGEGAAMTDDRSPSPAALDAAEGPLQRWAATPPAVRMALASEALMEIVCTLRASGLREWELLAAVGSVLAALETRARPRAETWGARRMRGGAR